MESLFPPDTANSTLPESESPDPVADEASPPVTFADMNLIKPLFDAIEHAGYKTATPVQSAVIPLAMRGKDVIGQAQTGTGKTAAFLVPFMNRWRPHKLKGPIGLVMCPTRELALQVAQEAEKLAPSRRFRTVAVYGGARMGKQLEGLSRGCDLVVGTPGRIIDHLRRGTLNLDNVRYVVLDEADRMLDIGFRPDIERILRRCPSKRQTLLMSATVPDTIKRLVNRYMIDPTHLNLSPNVLTVDKIRQSFITVDEDKKFELLLKVLEREKPRQCLIFVERKRWGDRLYEKLLKFGRSVKAAESRSEDCRDSSNVATPASELNLTGGRLAVIHGDLAQSQREKIMAAFRAAKVHYLIATDVASRGIDVSGISHVINYDLPMDIEAYVHRIGRTGRIGKDGVAISFVTPEQGGHLTEIEKTINRLIDEDRVEGFEAYTPRRVAVRGGEEEKGRAGEEVAEAPPAPRKPVFGKFVRRYSTRL
jgi:ATP-dependent RNA helicase DeaD